MRRLLAVFVGVTLGAGTIAASAGCAGFASSTRGVRRALDQGRPQSALEQLNDRLDVESAEQVPPKLGGDRSLYLLDRAMVLQVLERWELSSRDLQIADKQIQMLDFSREKIDEVGRYLFSDDVGPYQAPPYEKLMINTVNMVSYLVRRDASGARVEARRLAVLQRYLSEHEGHGAELLGPGSYLAGFTFEHSGDPDEALRFYDEALRYQRYDSLVEPVGRLARRGGYRSPRIEEAIAAYEERCGEPEACPDPEASGDLLVVASHGRVPAKRAKRVPIGLALTYAAPLLSPHDRRRANRIAAQGLVTWVNYPELGPSVGDWRPAEIRIDGADVATEDTAIEQEVRAAWQQARGAVMASAITRALARLAAGTLVRKGTGGGVAGVLASLTTQAAMSARDTPDTRSWSTLPAQMTFARLRVAPGLHRVTIRAGGTVVTREVSIEAGGWGVVAQTSLR